MSDITHFFVIYFASQTLAKHPDMIIHATEPDRLPCFHFLVKWTTYYLLHKPRGGLVLHL